MKKLPVVAAIPNYMMAEELGRLLPQVAAQGYSDIFVLDDASRDDGHSREVAAAFGEAQFIAGDTNKGAGANRNRIIGALGYDALIHFIDADVELETNDTALLVRDLFPKYELIGCLGGLARTANGMQNVWNYGPRPGLRSNLGAVVQAHIEPLLVDDPARAAHMRRQYSGLLRGRPDPQVPPVRTEVYWNIEQSMVIPSRVFARLGGFDESLRETEIHDLAIRMHKAGLRSYFDPGLSIRHTEGNVRHYDRHALQRKEKLRIARMHGLGNWLLSADRFS